MINESHLREMINDHCRDEEGKLYWLYADKGYSDTPFTLCPYACPSPLQQRINGAFSRERINVEWSFGKIVNTLQSLDFTRIQKVLKSMVGVWYPVCVLLTNCAICLYGSVSSVTFKCDPPSLSEYLTPVDDSFRIWREKYRPDRDVMALFGDNDWFDSLAGRNGDDNVKIWEV